MSRNVSFSERYKKEGEEVGATKFINKHTINNIVVWSPYILLVIRRRKTLAMVINADYRMEIYENQGNH